MFLFTIPKEVKVHSTYAYLIGLVFSVLFSSLFFTLHAQKLVRNNNYLFENYSAEDGLSFIYDIVQDREGYLWVGTQTGLLKYDGYQFNMVLPPADNDKTKFIEGIAWIIEEDSEGFIWMLSNLLTISKIDPNTGVFRIYAPQVDSNLVLLNRGVTAIMPDSAYQGVWVGTRQGLLLLQDKFYPSEGPPVVTAFPFANFTTSPDTVNGQYISQLYRDEEGSLWIGTNRGFSKLLQADPDKGQIQLKHYVRTPGDSSGLGINYISLLSPAKEGSFWVLGGRINSNNNYSAHMQHFNPFTEEFKDVEFSLPGQVSISTLLEDQSANIWLGTIGKGLHKRSLRKESDNEVGKELSFDFDLDVAGIDNQNRVHNLIIGHDGNIWFSTFTGLYKFSPSKNSFQFFDLPDLKSQNIPYVLSFATDRNGQIWIGSSGGGLFRFDPERDSIFSVPQLGGVPIPEQNIISVYADSLNNLWLSTMKGIFRFDLIKQKMVFFSDASKKLEGIAWPNQIFEDNSGRIWFPTTGRGLLVLDPVSENYQHYLPISGDSNSLASYKVWQVFQDSKGGLWTATLDGLQQIIPKGDDPSKFQFKSVSSLNGKELLWLHEDQKGRFWVSTFMEGLYLLDSTKNILKQYYRKDGLSGVVNSIFEDQTGILWLSGGLGIVRFDPEKETFTSYGPEQGIRFAPYGRMGFQTQEGKILFSAGNDGFYRFDPATFNTNAVPPKVHITEIRLFEQPLVPGGNPYLTEAIDSQTVLRLPYDQNSLTFSFVGLHFDHPEKNEYSFTLEGHEQEWSSAGSERSARYSNLPPGDYSFRVKASNSDGLWNEIGAKIRVIIRPPWWQTLWAKTIYAISFLGLLFGLYRWRSAVQRRKIRQMEKDLAQEQSVSTRLRQVDQLKDQFLANTSHELRTPLHGMIGLSESIIEKTEDPEQKEDLSMIISSGKRLNSLINDILDFSKLKNYDIELVRKPIDLRSLTDIVLRNNTPLTKGKGLQLINDIPEDLLPVDGDENRLQQILYNLVGNAIKFTESGYVKVKARQKEISTPHEALPENAMIEVSVEDTGIGIPKDKIETIFQEFEQGDGSISREFAGTGLGLSISKKLVELHGGKIWVESHPEKERLGGQGSTFFFTLPASNKQATTLKAGPAEASVSPPATIISPTELANPIAAIDGQAIQILVVDDEPINQQVLKNHLSGKGYYLTQALNGEEAIQAIDQQGPFDLVLLDVMMPRMSGYEVCQQIRKKYLPSELPVIMVTAKDQLMDIVQGLSVGANDYLPKPFHKEELLARINTQLDLHNIFDVAGRFVPNEFLHSLNRSRITEVMLGDHTEKQVTVMFSDIRDYTTLAEIMTPEENFNFINAFHRRMGPIIQEHKGFINQYLGDGIMAIFPADPENAIQAAVKMQKRLRDYNEKRLIKGRKAIRMGIGLHTGSLIMGIIGDENRMDATTIADTVNTASRIESLTKHFGTSILLSEDCLLQMKNKEDLHLRYLGQVKVKGKKEPVGIYECYDGDPMNVVNQKNQTQADFEYGLSMFYNREFPKAAATFDEILKINPGDGPARLFLNKSSKSTVDGVPENWDGVEVMSFK